MVFAMASEIERELISSRTKEALRAKKEQGKTDIGMLFFSFQSMLKKPVV
jgi:DNA invertase Pin-like site-specific DNA recombinase